MNYPKITMLGPSGSGKTCYLISMFNMLEAGLKGGITLSTPNLDDGLRLNMLFDQMCEGGNGRWPAGTSETTNYTFSLNHSFKSVFTFDWLDYRGGALKSDSSHEDVNILINRLKESIGILICISAEEIARENSAMLKQRLNVGKINNMIQQIPDDGALKPFISIVVTKSDFLNSDQWPRETLVQKIRDLFPAFFTNEGDWDVSILKVSLGRGLVSDNNFADLEPRDVHLPILDFARRYHELLSCVCLEAQQELHERKNQLSIQPSFFEKIFGASNSNGDEIIEIQKNLDEINHDLVKSTKIVQLLKDELKDRHYRYQSGNLAKS